MAECTQILEFLKQLKANNDREWFTANKNIFNNAKDQFESIIERMIAQITGFDNQMEGTFAKDCIYRIYRDVRFGKDKTPYKTNFGAVMAPGGKKSKKAFYYIQIEPGDKSFIAGGQYLPEKETLTKIRQEIDYNANVLRNILTQKKLKQYFGKMEGDQLKKAPKGYDPNDANIDLLKYKSFLLVHYFKDAEVTSPSFIKSCVKMFETMKPFNDFLNTAVE